MHFQGQTLHDGWRRHAGTFTTPGQETGHKLLLTALTNVPAAVVRNTQLHPPFLPSMS